MRFKCREDSGCPVGWEDLTHNPDRELRISTRAPNRLALGLLLD